MVAVPYYGQWESADLIADILAGRCAATDDPLWTRSGALNPSEYEFWSWHACGVASLRSVLAAHGRTPPPLVPLARELLAAGAYVATDTGLRGLIYAPAVTYLAQRWAMDSEVYTGWHVATLRSFLHGGGMALASVHVAIREATVTPPFRGGHLICAHAATPHTVTFHNPSGTTLANQNGATVPWDVFERYFAGRGIAFPATTLTPHDDV